MRYVVGALVTAITLMTIVVAYGLTLAQTANAINRRENMKMNIVIDGHAIKATLNESQASRDFANMLPLTLELKDYAGTEKISDLPAKLSVAGSPDGASASKGDITFYAPWGNLAIFYRGHGYATGLVKIGQLNNPDALPAKKAPYKATFELDVNQ